jgi:hypothetical protein
MNAEQLLARWEMRRRLKAKQSELWRDIAEGQSEEDAARLDRYLEGPTEETLAEWKNSLPLGCQEKLKEALNLIAEADKVWPPYWNIASVPRK